MPGIDEGQSGRHLFGVRFDDGGNDFVLGLEVVVHISDRDVRHLRDVGQRRALDALLVSGAARPQPPIGLVFPAVPLLGAVPVFGAGAQPRWPSSHHRPEGVVQDFDTFQEPPPIDLPAAWIFQVPDMDLPATEPA